MGLGKRFPSKRHIARMTAHKHRMKKLLFLFIFILFGTYSAYSQPQISFDQTTQELGTMLWHTPRTATFKITNKGTSDLRITEIRKDCGCTNVEYTQTDIAPGGTGEIRATYNAEMLGHFTKSISVYTNLTEKPTFLTIMGQVSMTQTEPSVEYPYQIGDYYLSTDDIEYDDVNRGDTPQYVLYIFNSSKKSYRPELMHLPKYLSAKADPEVIRPNRVGRVLLTLDSQKLPAMGLTQTSIYLSRFMGDRVNKETEINVSATLLPDFLDTPTQHALSPKLEIDSTHITLSLAGNKKKATSQLVLKNVGKTPLVISALQVYNPGISVSIGKRRIDSGDEQKLKISVSSNNNYFKGRRRILLITNDPDRPKIVIDVTIQK